MSTQRFDSNWLAYKGTTTGWDGSLVAGTDADIPLPIVATAAGSSASVDVPSGSLVLTGYAPTVLLPRTVSVPAASLILTGYAPTVQTPRVVLVPAASLVLTGFAPTVTAGTGSGATVDVPAGSLVLTGFAPTVVAPVSVSVPVAGLVLTGYAPTVSNAEATPEADIIVSGGVKKKNRVLAFFVALQNSLGNKTTSLRSKTWLSQRRAASVSSCRKPRHCKQLRQMFRSSWLRKSPGLSLESRTYQ